MAEVATRRRRDLLRKLLIAAAVAFVLFVAGGFFVAPPVLKARILREMSARLGREVSVGTVRVNPFELSATIDDLTIKDRDGAVFASWKRAYANYRFTSFLGRDFTFDELSFTSPYARFVIEKSGALNVDDLLRIFRAGSARPATGPPPVWTFAKVHVEDARVGFTDRMRDPVFESTIGPFLLDLDRFSTSRDSRSPYSFNGSTESGESFAWTGHITTDPLVSSGELKLENVRLPKYKPYYETGRPFQVRDGRISLSGAYDFAWTPTQKTMRVKGANLVLEEAKIARPGAEAPDIEVARLAVENANIDGVTYEAAIERIALDGGHVTIRHDKDGTVNLYEMIRPFVEPAPETAPASAAAPAAPSPAPQVSVGTLAVSGVTVDAEDLAPERPFKVTAHDVALTMTGIDNKPGTRCPVSLSARFDEKGTVSTKGTFSSDFHEGALDVDVADVDIRATDTYLAPFVRARIASGAVSAKGHVDYEMPPRDALRFRYQGEVRVTDLALVHAETASPLGRFAVLKVAPMDVRLNPMSIAIGEVAIGAPQLTLEAAPDRTLNLTQALVEPEATAAEGPPATIPDFKIDTLRIQNGSAKLTDRSIEPAVSTSLSKIDGTIQGISSADLQRARVDVKALFDGVAPVAIVGRINPIARKDFTDLTVTISGADITPFSPYAGKYLGYGLAQGKLAADMKYRIAERHFTSENVFTVDQFQLGEKTESPDAVKLPVKLAVAVLRDKNGQIVLDVPAEGSVDDPEFRLGRVIVRAIVNVLTKIVTSPFRLLARAFGGKDEDVDYQVFLPGESALQDSEKGKLDVVAKSLLARPELTLSVAGLTDPAADGEALKKARLETLLRTQKWKSVSRTNPALASPEAVTIPVDEYATWLRSAFDAAFPPATPPEPPKTTPEMEAKLLESMTVSDDELRALGAARGRSVRDYLTATGSVPAERVFLAESGPKEAREPAPRVWLELK